MAQLIAAIESGEEITMSQEIHRSRYHDDRPGSALQHQYSLMFITSAIGSRGGQRFHWGRPTGSNHNEWPTGERAGLYLWMCPGPKTLGTGVHEPAIAPERPADMTMIWLEVARCTRQLSPGKLSGLL